MAEYKWSEVPRAEAENLMRILHEYRAKPPDPVRWIAVLEAIQRCERAALDEPRSSDEIRQEMLNVLIGSLKKGPASDCLVGHSSGGYLEAKRLRALYEELLASIRGGSPGAEGHGCGMCRVPAQPGSPACGDEWCQREECAPCGHGHQHPHGCRCGHPNCPWKKAQP